MRGCMPAKCADVKRLTTSGHKLFLICGGAVIAFVAGLALGAEPQTGVHPDTLCVMTYNLRFASPSGPNAWPDRRPFMRDLIRQVNPDVIGTQEGLYNQLKELAVDLPEFDWIGLGRRGGSRDEFVAVFYRRDRLEPIDFDHFWLSDTPERIGSATWGNKLPRMVTTVRFRDRKTQREFHLWNTHFDHQSATAREKSAALIRERVTALESAAPVILVGDFNAPAGASKPFEILTGAGFFVDTWDVAGERKGQGFGTFNNFNALAVGGPRIDWILARGKVVVESVEIVTNQYNGRFPSDHCPVVARIRLGDTN